MANTPPKKVVFKRLYYATPEKLFKCFTDAKLLAKWWGPANWTNPTCQFEPKVGGKIYIVMHGEIGPGQEMDAPMTGTVLEIDPPKKLVFSSQALFGNDPEPQIDSITKVSFVKKGEQTQLSVDVEVKMFKPQALMALTGMEAGWSGSLDKLATVSEDTKEREIVIIRPIQAPIAKVWKAITDPKQVVQWWGPDGFTNTNKRMEVKEGGVWELTMHGPDGKDWPNYSVFTQVVPERVLSYDHGSDKSLKGHFKATITLAPMGGMTFVTLRSVFESKAVRDGLVKKVNAIEGGNQTLSHLEEFVKKN